MADTSATGPLAQLAEALAAFRAQVDGTRSEQEIRELQARYLGRKGSITELSQSLGQMPREERPAFGRELNRVKGEIEREVERRLGELARAERERWLATRVDVTLPGRRRRPGRIHPILQVWRELTEIFGGLGFSLAEGPEIDTDWNTFEALNIPADHPARQMQDTFYVADAEDGSSSGDIVLRTHTSPVQIRTMRAQPPPVKIIAPGRVYRRDDDPTHSPMFFQIEGLYVDRHVTMAHLKGVILHFVRRFFGPGTPDRPAQVRFRPSYFPFVEPGADIEMSCTHCAGRGCRTCKQSGFLEIGGAGMVHPKVLENVGYDPQQVSGFAFGMGLDRMAMLRFGVTDIKLFFENDVRFLTQF